MSARPGESEHIPVGRPRPAPPRVWRRSRPVAAAAGAGTSMIAVTALFAFAGWKAGAWLDVPTAGTLAGGFVGALIAFAATYVRFRDI